MNTTLCIALLALAPQELPRSASAPSLQAPAATQQDVPFLADLPLLGEMFQAPVPDPDLRWNGATEDVYRRALHQRDVRGNYAEAVRLLLSIADSDQVIQIPGQASWVLGQAALALSMDGRTVEAEKMLPGIRNGSAGTDLEPQVGVLLDRIASYRGGNQELDETFRVYLWERLQEFPRDDKDRGSDIRDYGRLTLPYLEQIVSGQLRMGASGFGQGDIAQVQKAMRFALAVADDGFADRTLALLREFPPLTTRVVLPASPPPAMDDQAASAQARLYAHLAEESDAARREVGMEGVLRVAERSGEDTAIRFLEGVLQQSGDARRAWILASLREGTIYRDAAWIDFGAQVASGSDFEAREAARWGMVGEAHRAAELRSFAATSDSTRADKLRFLMQFCKPDEDAGDHRNALEGLASAALKSVGAYVAQPFGWSKRRVEDPIDKGLVVGFSGDSDPGVAATAAYAVSVANDDVLVDAIFPILDAATRTALLASERSWDFSRETALALLELAVAGSTEARTLLSRGNFAHLRVAEMQSAAVDWTGEEWERYAQGRSQRTSESYNQADLADLLAAPGGFPRARAYAVDRGLAVPRELVLRGLEGVDGWDFKAGKPDSWRNLLSSVAGRIRFDDTGNGNSEPLGALGEALVRRTWSVCAESGWSLTDLSVDEIMHFQWETEPERALRLAMELVTDAESLARYREGWSPGMDTGGLKQKFLAYCLERGWWPTEGRDAKVEPWLEPEQAEFVEVMRLLLSPDRDPAQALSMLEYLPATRRQLESEMARYWQDPDLAYRMVDVYDETAELKEKVPQMLATWQLPDLLGRAQVLAAMASTLDERVVPVLLEALGDPDQDVAGVARKGLERLREVREQREYWEAWEATGSSLSPVVALLQKLKSDNRTVRLAAIRSLGTMGAEEALPFLVDLLEDDDADVRAAAAAALEKING